MAASAMTRPDNVPVVILCGGEGTRFREETQFRPKALINIGEYPILWHVMRIYLNHGFKRFILCLGYKGSMIKEYFDKYEMQVRDYTMNMGTGQVEFRDEIPNMDWQITFAETGSTTLTGSRIKRIEKYIDTENFMVTYADGVADVAIAETYKFHLAHGKIGTVTGARSASQFGELIANGDDHKVTSFAEKPKVSSLINGGFFVFRREFFNYLDNIDDCILERDPMEKLVGDSELQMYRHEGFWQCLDTYKDYLHLNKLWTSNQAPWISEL